MARRGPRTLTSRPSLREKGASPVSIHNHDFDQRAAIVSRPPLRAKDPDLYLAIGLNGSVSWTDDVEAATPFNSMREAMRAAFRLPGAYRAFGLPLRTELSAHDIH